MRRGTDSTDSECGEHGPHRGLERGHVVGIIPGVILVALIIGGIILYKNKRGKCCNNLKCIMVTVN